MWFACHLHRSAFTYNIILHRTRHFPQQILWVCKVNARKEKVSLIISADVDSSPAKEMPLSVTVMILFLLGIYCPQTTGHFEKIGCRNGSFKLQLPLTRCDNNLLTLMLLSKPFCGHAAGKLHSLLVFVAVGWTDAKKDHWMKVGQGIQLQEKHFSYFFVNCCEKFLL